MKKYLLYFILFSNLSFAQNEFKHSVFFDTDRYNVKATQEKIFALFLSKLDSLSIEKITIFGYCDDRGPSSYNLKLSKRRAGAVKSLFIANEVSENLITVFDGKGELELDAGDNVESVRRNNRRVDIVIQPSFTKEDDSLEIPTTQTILRQELKEGDKIRLKNIYFKTGYSIVTSESITTLKEIADILIKKENIYFTIQGHVCCTHDKYDAVDRKTNKRNLSVARAKFIYNFLDRRGVEKHRMKYVGLKRKHPLGGEPKYDRRVEILITYISDRD